MPHLISTERTGFEEGFMEGFAIGFLKGFRQGCQEGLREAIALDLNHKFGSDGQHLLALIPIDTDSTRLRIILYRIIRTDSQDEIRKICQLLGSHPAAGRTEGA